MTEISLSLADVGEAADLFGEMFHYVDQRVQRQLTPLVHTRQVALECCWDDEVNELQAGIRGTFAAAWHMDVESLQIWTDPGCSVTIQFAVAHTTAPDVRTIIGTFTAASFLLLEDDQVSAVLSATDPPRTSPDTSGYALTNAGFLTELLDGDMVTMTLTAVGGGAKLAGVKLRCMLRGEAGPDASGVTQPA